MWYMRGKHARVDSSTVLATLAELTYKKVTWFGRLFNLLNGKHVNI